MIRPTRPVEDIRPDQNPAGDSLDSVKTERAQSRRAALFTRFIAAKNDEGSESSQ
jgi:hypothetical protein